MTATPLPRSVSEALGLIPDRRDKLNVEDDKLRRVIRHIEFALNKMSPGVTATYGYSLPNDNVPRRLAFTVASKRWLITWAERDEDAVPLLSAPRNARAEVFKPMFDGLAPIELLVIEVAVLLDDLQQTRSPMLEVAGRLHVALTKAGFSEPKAE